MEKKKKEKESISTQILHNFKTKFYNKFEKASNTKNYKVVIKNLEKINEEILKVVNKLLKSEMRKMRINYNKYL